MSGHRVALMQPYFLPYIDYWRLLATVDEFVAYDDVQFSSGGWVNRNRIRLDGRVVWLTVPVARAPLATPIADRRLVLDDATRRHLESRVATAYRSAPHREAGLELLHDVLADDGHRLGAFLIGSLRTVAGRIGISTPIRAASDLGVPRTADPQNRVIAFCQRLGASEYYNLAGGRTLYSSAVFARAGLGLRFPTGAGGDEGDEGDDRTLSVLDVIMRRGLDGAAELAAGGTWDDGAGRPERTPTRC